MPSSISAWGGQVLHDGSTWHMIASEIAQNCGINAWTRNSRIVHATSPSLDASFVVDTVVHDIFAHEPTVARAPTGEWVMWYTSGLTAPRDAPCNCSDGSTPPSCSGTYSADPSFLSTAPSLAGPWSKPLLVPLLDCNATYCQHDMNLAGVIHDNNSFVGLVKVWVRYRIEVIRYWYARGLELHPKYILMYPTPGA